MMRQVNAATATSTTMFAGGEDVSAAVNHRQRIAAEQQRRLEVSLMSREDYTDTPEGQARLQRQQERSHMQEEELLVLRIVEAERQAARALQREKELEEERRIKEQYMAKIRAQREQQEKEAREKEEKRKLEMEKKMKALKEAADAKARAEFVAKQSALEEEARLAREKLSMEVENAQMQVEDEFGRAMQQEVLAEQERQRQIAAEQEEWRAFQEREHEKQREATQLRRAAMAQQYEQDKQRRLQIHKLQKERAAQQAERKTLQNSQQEQILSPENSKADGERALTNAIETKAVALDETKEVSLDDTNQATDSAAELSAEEHNGVDLNEMRSSQKDDMNVKSELASQAAEAEEQPLSCVNPLQDEAIGKDPTTTAAQNVTPTADCLEQENLDPQTGNAPPEASINESKLECALEDPKPVDGDVAETLPDEKQQVEAVKTIWTIAAAQSQGFIPFAQILSVMESSPAMQASLCSGDLLIEFGGIMSSTPKCLIAIAECVQKNVNNVIPVGLLRPSVVDDKHPFTSAGADLYGDTVLHAATTSGNVAVVELLFKSGCVKVDDKNHGRLTAAHVASNADTLIFLGEKAEADLLATDAEERMPLAYACLRNDVDSIQYLCKKHPEFVDYADVRGNTPLHVAAWLGLREASEVLIRFLPSIALHVTNEDGQNPAELARSCQMEDVAVFLEGAMAAAESNSRIAMAIAATYRGLKAEKQTDN
ncbi:hypothetical protein PHYBOEH_007550 [Phytophthora boehmeriae]|uniref:Uncharacterized protein n=1 Tax=Phytophthora boehmeriae TaxID=109152 RepID=A0A8T1W6V9_9STRA|nr:hypothetical protein PHYBOEH_007550 [Phytophthora boehmeriae]